MTVYIFGNTFFLFTNTVSLAISFIMLSTKTHLDKRPLSVVSKAQAKLIQTSMNNICKIQVKNRTKLQQLKMFMQYNNASNITVLKFKTFPDQFFNFQSMYKARFSKLYKSPRPRAFTPKLKPSSQSITQIPVFVLALEQHSTNHRHRMKRELWPTIGIHNTDPTSYDSQGKGTQSQGEEFGFWGN